MNCRPPLTLERAERTGHRTSGGIADHNYGELVGEPTGPITVHHDRTAGPVTATP
ncbi:hypothetical protein ACQPYA_17380 [Micromonospora sp. CA-263727]|uniref:hypothetical protein n=1 Tax=Micromonospora sp. CA-263727 TaxID=3239967 RepID=UPI003D91218E